MEGKCDNANGTSEWSDDWWFTTELEPSIELTSPVGGEIWLQGSSHDITWNSTNVDSIKIELYKGGLIDSLLVPSFAASSGSWEWTIPENQEPGNEYTIKITDLYDELIFDESDVFEIQAPGRKRYKK